MEKKFKPGDVVRLKSGGPTMTVQRYVLQAGTEVAECSWFAGTDLHTRDFRDDSLESASQSQTGTPLIRR